MSFTFSLLPTMTPAVESLQAVLFDNSNTAESLGVVILITTNTNVKCKGEEQKTYLRSIDISEPDKTHH